MANFGNAFNSAAGAVSDIFTGFGDEFKAKGARIEEGMYKEAAGFARQNVDYTKEATAIKAAQQQREETGALGATSAAVAGAGFEASGSALDILRDSARQGSLALATVQAQGQITEAGYQEQAKALDAQAEAAGVAADAADEAATGSWISAGIKAVGAVASLF
jgi:hypothetical protein